MLSVNGGDFDSKLPFGGPLFRGAEVLCGRPWFSNASVSYNFVLCQSLWTFSMFSSAVVALRMATAFICVFERSSSGYGNPCFGVGGALHIYYIIYMYCSL